MISFRSLLALRLLLQRFFFAFQLGGRATHPCRRASLAVCLMLALAWAPNALAQENLEVGYGVLDPGADPFQAAAAALFRLTNPDGTLVTEAGVGAVGTLSRGRLFVQQDPPVLTGVAIVNASDQSDTVQLTLRDMSGQVLSQGEVELPPGQHLARFIQELLPLAPADVVGTLTFESQHPDGQLAAVTLRQSLNGFAEPLLTTLPVADLDSAGPQASLVFPQVGGGDNLSTQIVLFDRSSQASQGTIRFFDANGAPLQLGTVSGTVSELPFAVADDGVFFVQLTAPAPGQVGVGYAVVTTEQGPLPAGSAIFRFADELDRPISEAGVGSVPATDRIRLVVDQVGTRTGVAVANLSDTANGLDIDLLDPNGTVLASANQQLAAGGHLARFADEIFGLEEGFTGMLEIRAQEPVVPITLKLTTNQRGQSILTTLPIGDLANPPAIVASRGVAAEDNRRILPQMGIGGSALGDFSTRMLLLSTQPSQPSGAELSFRTGAGEAWSAPLRPSDLSFAVGGGELGSLNFGSSADPKEPEEGSRTSALVTSEGAILSVQDGDGNLVTLQIPPFALLDPVNVTLSVLNTPPRATFLQNIYPGVRIQPQELVLNQPALLEIRLAEPPRNPDLSALFWLDEDDQVRALGNQTIDEDSAQGEINHFGIFTWERLTLADALFHAALIAALDPEQRALEGLPDDEDLQELLAALDDANTLDELRRIRDLLADQDTPDTPEAAALLAEAAQRFLDQEVPQDPCGLYHGLLIRFAALVMQLDDAGLQQDFQERVESVDQQCLQLDLSGTWLVQSFDQGEECELLVGCPDPPCRWEESEDDSEIEAVVAQNGSAFTVNFPEVPQVATLTGRLQQTGDAFQPVFFTVTDQGSNTLDCRIFFETQGLGLDFGAPICNAPNTCVPLSCQETDTVTAGVSPDGSSFLGIEFWDFTASVQETPSGGGPALTFTYRCRGASQVAGTKSEP